MFEEAKKIAETTANEDKFIFILQYDANQIDFLMSVLKAVGAEVILFNEEAYTLDAFMNMKQLAFVKPLNCIERVSTHEELKTAISDEESVTETIAAEPLTMDKTPGRSVEVATASVGSRSSGSSCSTPANTSMSTAKEVSVESFTYGHFYYSTSELWYKFVPPETRKYTICTIGPRDTIGELYDYCGNLIERVDDREECGKVNFRILRTLQANQTYYVKVTEAKSNTGSFDLRVTEEILVDKIKFTPTSLCLTVGAEYELPVSPGTFLNIAGTTPLTALNVEIEPANATEKSLTWGVSDNDIIYIKTVYKNGQSTQTIKVLKTGTARLSAFDKKTNGKSDECAVVAITPYERMLQTLCGFSSEAIRLISNLYERVDATFTSENTLQKTWRCARLLSEFSYDSFSFNDVAGSLTNQENRKTYFMNTLSYTENEYNTLRTALSNNHTDIDTIDFTHLQYSLAARLAYTLDKDGWASNLGSQFKTGNWGIYSDEDISYLGGWLGDATLRNDGGTGVPVLKNDDYMADLDAENIYRLILQGYSSIDALNVYYLNMTSSNTRANMFLQYIPYSTVKQKIFYELIDAQLYIFMSNASSQGDMAMTQYWLNLINNEQYHFDEIKSKYPDTYDFLMSLENRLLTISHYQ